MREMVLYYNTVQNPNVAKLKGVLVRMGVRIKNITPEQVTQTVGYLAGIEGYPESEMPEVLPVIEEEMLVMRGFTSRRMDELLMNLRKAGVPKIALKAVVTESNCGWSFYHLYEEIREEHEKMSL
ncbi:MAG: DUF3783 domain-containing protein [Hungatella hathewayi]|nr:DUF3783 domain-containing protein [Hungatella hathewayi]